jgi:tetratricopeptide (TPR) repeat protein/DNA-binding CsgD family transcriptional regulator
MVPPPPGTAHTAAPPLALHIRGRDEPLVGRAIEVAALRQGLEAARRGQISAVSLEGEPGIGKSRLLLVAEQMAVEHGFTSVSVLADEELRGPFLVARSILRSSAASCDNGPALEDVQRALDAISGADDATFAGMSPDEKLLRSFDLGAVAIRSVASSAPLALLLDDLQWADEDSVRMLRYMVRSVVDVPLFLAIAVRPEEMAASEAAPLLADMERMGALRRVPVGRLSQPDSAEVLRKTLGGDVDGASAATMHAQAEGVPFILVELARTYREAGLVQQIDGTWTLARNAGRLVPSAVRTLIQRRASHLPEPTRAVLAEAAVIGRAFSLRDLLAVKEQLGEVGAHDTTELAEHLRPAVTTGLLSALTEASAADYRFAHEHVQEFVLGTLTAARRRVLHGAVVDLLTSGVEIADESLPLLAKHALAAGDHDRASRFTIDAARAALAAHAPEEVLRIVDLALPAISAPKDRVALLTARDEALEMLRRPTDRIDGLAELTALSEALGDTQLELDAMLRRAAALRLSGEEDRAVQLASQVRETAAELGDRGIELAACLELGQAHMGRPLGESYMPSQNEADFDRAQEAFERAQELARDLEDLAALAATYRELGVITSGRVRQWYVEYEREHGLEALIGRVALGEGVESILADLGIAPLISRATTLLQEAVELFDNAGDQRGLMSSVIALAYIQFGPDIHMVASARRIEEIRNLATQLISLSRESERDRAEAQMLYGVHVFARAKVVLDLAIERGADAYDKAHLLGERSLEFLAAGGVAMVHLELGDAEEAGRWVDRAAAAALAAPTPFKARQLELWRGQCCATTEDVAGMREHLERAVQLAEEQRRPAARCEALAQLATEAARLGAVRGDEELLGLAEQRAAEAKAISPSLPGHPLWGAQADAALVRVRLARDDPEGAAQAARSAMGALLAAELEDLELDIRLPVSRGLLAGGSEAEREATTGALRVGLMLVAQRILDEEVRVRWFCGPVGGELSELAGSLDQQLAPEASSTHSLEDDEVRLLRLLVEGRTNREIAAALGTDEEHLSRRLVEFYAHLGIGSRAEATTFAFRERVI